VHLVVAHILDIDRAEGIEADMQGHKADAHPLGPQTLEQLRREMESSRWGRRRTGNARVDGLIALRIRQRLMNIGRQRHAPYLLDKPGNRRRLALSLSMESQELRCQLEADKTAPRLGTAQHLALQARRQPSHPIFAEEDARPFAQTPPGPDQSLPGVRAQVGPLGQQQHLNRSAGLLTPAKQTRRDHAALVGDQQIARPQIVANIAKVAVLQGPRGPMDHEQARGIARLYWPLGD
jgi:hypothetical protein